MQLRQLAWVMVFCAVPHVALAQTCTLALGGNGVLAIDGDGTHLSSTEAGGVAGGVTILSIGSNVIDVSAPTRVLSPAAYDASGEVLEVAYAGLNSLTGISQSFTDGATSFSIGTIPLSLLHINNRIYNPNGFAAGTYTTQTQVTCR